MPVTPSPTRSTSPPPDHPDTTRTPVPPRTPSRRASPRTPSRTDVRRVRPAPRPLRHVPLIRSRRVGSRTTSRRVSSRPPGRNATRPGHTNSEDAKTAPPRSPPPPHVAFRPAPTLVAIGPKHRDGTRRDLVGRTRQTSDEDHARPRRRLTSRSVPHPLSSQSVPRAGAKRDQTGETDPRPAMHRLSSRSVPRTGTGRDETWSTGPGRRRMRTTLDPPAAPRRVPSRTHSRRDLSRVPGRNATRPFRRTPRPPMHQLSSRSVPRTGTGRDET